MPLTAKYTWAESKTAVQLQVPLRGQPISKVDVFATECYLKVSFPPYLLELDLDGCIDSMQPKARVENGTLMIKARKKEGHVGLWGSLGKPVDRKCDPKVKARREESIKEKLKQEQELKERVSLRKHQDERLALRSQMSVEEDERRRIEDIKAEEKEKEEADVYRAFAELAAKQNREESTALDEAPAATTARPTEPGGREKRRQRPMPMPPCLTCSSTRDRLGTIDEGVSEEGSLIPPTTDSSAVPAAKHEAESPIWEDETGSRIDDEEAEGSCDDGGESKETADSASGPSGQQQGRQQPLDDDDAEEKAYNNNNTCNGDDDDETPARYTPAPRASVGVVPVGFTTRLFPTPLRESKVADESAWIMKNRRHLHKNKSLVGRLPAADSESAGGGGGGGRDGLPADISETDPVWLKGRGDDLYRGGDFLGAVNAYTAALDADPKAAACLSNRAACYLRLSNTGGGNGNDRSRHAAACVVDCGAALEILRALPETGPSQAKALARRSLAYRELGHYSSSLEDCRAALLYSPGDAALLEEIARGEPLARAEACKKEAATRFASRDVRGACEMYTAALEAVPRFPSALSNRAACYLALGKPRECVRDCTAVLDMLSFSITGNNSQGQISGDTRRTSEALATAGPSEEHAAASGEGTLAPSSSPPLPPPPAGSMPPPGSEKHTKWVLTTGLRRARAKVQLEDFEGALRDYRAADSVSPGNKEVQNDLRELEREMEREVQRKPLQQLDPAAS